jgi:hypothetical protein
MQCQREVKRKAILQRRKGRPRMRWPDDVESGLKKMR